MRASYAFGMSKLYKQCLKPIASEGTHHLRKHMFAALPLPLYAAYDRYISKKLYYEMCCLRNQHSL